LVEAEEGVQKTREEGRMARCVIYARVSSRTQSWGSGIVRQIESCQAKARKDKAGVLGVYVDIASGSGELPQRAAAIAQSKRLKCPVYVEDMTRWTRSGSDPSLFDDGLSLVICDPEYASFWLAVSHMIAEAT
jgi:predicted site-specific integrase-resolvase